MTSTIKLIMKARGITQETMGKMCGLASSSGIRRRLNKDSMNVDTALDMLEILGYDIVVRERGIGRRREDEILITREDEIEVWGRG